jgi:hypothetical protein
VPGTNVPYSLHTEAETTKTSRGLKSDDITLGVLSTDTTRTVPGTNVPYSLYTDAETTKTSRDVISDEITRGVLSTDTNRIIPGTNVLYSLYTEADTTKTSRGAISDDITRGVFSADTTGIVPGTNVPYSLCTDIVGERLSQGTSVIARRPLGDLRINNEAVRVLRVNPKLTIDTGECTLVSTRESVYYEVKNASERLILEYLVFFQVVINGEEVAMAFWK